jgi:hypothetical protein
MLSDVPSRSNAGIPWLRRFLSNNGGGTSFGDIEELLNCVWITRMWTFQEAALARSPVVVCGGSCLDWERFSLSVVFLTMVMSSEYCEKWADLIISRTTIQPKVGGDEIHPDDWRGYVDFFESLKKLRRFLMLIVLLSLLVSFPPVIWVFVAMKDPTLDGLIRSNRNTILSMLWLVETCSLIGALQLFAPSRILTWDQPRSQLFCQRLSLDLHTRLIQTLATRRSTDPRDMSFSLHSVLRLYSEEQLDVDAVDYAYSLGTIYRNLTVHLMQQSRGLEHLFLAGHKREFDAPSWVPNYSHHSQVHGITIEPAESSAVTATSAQYWRLHPNNDKVLIVKGFLFDVIKWTMDFQHTRATYEHTEDKTHVENLESLLRWGCSFEGRKTLWVRPLNCVFLQHVLSTASVPQINLLDVNAYLKILQRALSTTSKSHRRLRHQTAKINIMAKSLWSRIRTEQNAEYPNLLSTHIRVMNTFAKINMKVFESVEGHTGCCFGIAEPGDDLYWISGIGHPLIMRPNEPGVQFISMAYVKREGTALLNDMLAQAIKNKSASLSLDGSLMKNNHGSLLARASRRYKEKVLTSDPSDLWRNYIYLVQQTASQQTNGRIPHPKDAPWYESDPDHVLGRILPDVHIN